MNALPSTKDKTEGYFRRIMLLNFSAHFNEQQRDMDLMDKLRDELPGIFNWAIKGLDRLRKNNYRFSACKNMDELLGQYRMEQNPIISFFDEYASGKTTSYNYSKRGELTAVDYGNAEASTYEYDATGNLKKAINTNGDSSLRTLV